MVRRRRIWIAAVAAGLALGLAQAQSTSTFESRHAEWIDAYNSGDVEALGELYTVDAHFEDATGASFHGRQAIQQYFANFIEEGVIRMESDSLRTEATPDWALDFNTYDFYLADGTNVANGHSVILLREEEGAWRIFFHFSRSTPVAPEPQATN